MTFGRALGDEERSGQGEASLVGPHSLSVSVSNQLYCRDACSSSTLKTRTHPQAMPFCPGHRYLCPEEVRRSLRRPYHNSPPHFPTSTLIPSTPYSIVTPLTTILRCACPILLPLSVAQPKLPQDTFRIHSRKPQTCPRHHIPLPLAI